MAKHLPFNVDHWRDKEFKIVSASGDTTAMMALAAKHVLGVLSETRERQLAALADATAIDFTAARDYIGSLPEENEEEITRPRGA